MRYVSNIGLVQLRGLSKQCSVVGFRSHTDHSEGNARCKKYNPGDRTRHELVRLRDCERKKSLERSMKWDLQLYEYLLGSFLLRQIHEWHFDIPLVERGRLSEDGRFYLKLVY